MEFRYYDSDIDKAKLYESVRKCVAEIYEDEPEAFGRASVSENPYKDFWELFVDCSHLCFDLF